MKKLNSCICGMDDCFPGCGCEILALLGKKWSVFIMMHLMKIEKMRFNGLLGSLNGISPKSLSIRLKEFEELDLIIRKVEPTIPVKIRYSLNEKGKELGKLLSEMKSLVHSWI